MQWINLLQIYEVANQGGKGKRAFRPAEAATPVRLRSRKLFFLVVQRDCLCFLLFLLFFHSQCSSICWRRIHCRGWFYDCFFFWFYFFSTWEQFTPFFLLDVSVLQLLKMKRGYLREHFVITVMLDQGSFLFLFLSFS